ncbi:hypothetical protein [Microcoleus sp. CAWBG640]|uniref:hypothetical protein n=1 Tax=Microcoleus sp. CAWBG640 TaxID=2841653 RepID=UPI00312B79F5
MEYDTTLALTYAAFTLGNNILNIVNQKDEAEKRRNFDREMTTYRAYLDLENQSILAKNNHTYRLIEQMMGHEYAKVLENIRVENNIKTQIVTATINRQSKQLDQWEKDHPFDNPIYDTNTLKSQYQNHGMPIMLIAPFHDDTISDRGNDEGGFINYQTANYTGFQEARWLEGLIPKDGYFKRPLRRRDKDLDIIYSDLNELPIIIVWGVIQQRKRVHLQITHWNILPGTQGLYIKDYIGCFDVPLLPPENNKNELLELQDLVAQEAVVSVGILGDVYHLVQNPEHKRPRLQKYNIQDRERLKLLAQHFRSYYQLLGENEPDIEPFLLLDSAVMFAEINFKQEALNDVKSALKSWCYQKNLHPEIFPNSLNPEIMENLSNDDLNFLLKLEKTYQLIGDKQKASQIFNFTEKLEGFQQEQLKLQGINPAFLARLELEAEALSKKGFEVVFEPVANGYGLVLSVDTNLSLVFWIPEQYPHQNPKIAIKNSSGLEPIEFSPNSWQKNYTLADLVDAVLNARN